jgi:hypothetical protein
MGGTHKTQEKDEKCLQKFRPKTSVKTGLEFECAICNNGAGLSADG